MSPEDFDQFIADNMAAHPAERKVIRKVVKALKDAGKPVVEVYDGEEFVKVSTLRDVNRQAFNLDECWLYTEDASWVRLTMGEGWDVLCDHTVDLEDILEPVFDYIHKNDA